MSECCHFSSFKVHRIMTDAYLKSRAVNDSCSGSVNLHGKPRQDVV